MSINKLSEFPLPAKISLRNNLTNLSFRIILKSCRHHEAKKCKKNVLGKHKQKFLFWQQTQKRKNKSMLSLSLCCQTKNNFALRSQLRNIFNSTKLCVRVSERYIFINFLFSSHWFLLRSDASRKKAKFSSLLLVWIIDDCKLLSGDCAIPVMWSSHFLLNGWKAK